VRPEHGRRVSGGGCLIERTVWPLFVGFRAPVFDDQSRLSNRHDIYPAAPSTTSLLGQVVQSAHRANVPRLLRFLEDPDDLLFAESLPLHLVSVRLRKSELGDWTPNRGAGQPARGHRLAIARRRRRADPKAEPIIACNILNRIISLGRPVSCKIGRSKKPQAR
jgi:hypothetical protein